MSLIPEAVARLAEALIFAAEQPVSAAALSRHVGPEVDVTELIDVLTARHAGMGFQLVAVGGGWRFQTAPDLALSLQAAQEQDKRIPRVAMEVLTLIAYEQPTTRAEIEAARDTAVSQKTLDLLLELNVYLLQRVHFRLRECTEPLIAVRLPWSRLAMLILGADQPLRPCGRSRNPA